MFAKHIYNNLIMQVTHLKAMHDAWACASKVGTVDSSEGPWGKGPNMA